MSEFKITFTEDKNPEKDIQKEVDLRVREVQIKDPGAKLTYKQALTAVFLADRELNLAYNQTTPPMRLRGAGRG
jgi:hypothetical protein